MASKRVVDATGRGTTLQGPITQSGDDVPPPSSPDASNPQHSGVPSVVMAQVCIAPAAIATYRWCPATGLGPIA
jgi:hypothetical protein